LERATLDTPFLVVISRGRRADAGLAEAFPDRTIYLYDPDNPYVFVKRLVGGD
jgi:hypothetical protein